MGIEYKSTFTETLSEIFTSKQDALSSINLLIWSHLYRYHGRVVLYFLSSKTL